MSTLTTFNIRPDGLGMRGDFSGDLYVVARYQPEARRWRPVGRYRSRCAAYSAWQEFCQASPDHVFFLRGVPSLKGHAVRFVLSTLGHLA